MNASIVGLGLIGGSIARRLLAEGWSVTGFDHDPATVNAARAAGIRASVATADAMNVACDVVILALPVLSIFPALHQLAERDAALILDVASTKRAVIDAAEAAGIGARFVGCHPLAGSHESGFAAARADLFEGARVFLCPTPLTDPQLVRATRDLWQSLGALPEVVSADEHDHELAAISHLPQTLATALANALHSAGINHQRLGPGGRDMTRLAASNPAVWSDILLTNGDYLRQHIADVIAGLEEVLSALDQRDGERLTGVFAAGRSWTTDSTS